MQDPIQEMYAAPAAIARTAANNHVHWIHSAVAGAPPTTGEAVCNSSDRVLHCDVSCLNERRRACVSYARVRKEWACIALMQLRAYPFAITRVVRTHSRADALVFDLHSREIRRARDSIAFGEDSETRSAALEEHWKRREEKNGVTTMNLIKTLMDGAAPVGRVEGRAPQEDHTPRKAPPKAPPMSRADELGLLERKALEKGISPDELDETRRIGDCPAQIATRIRHLHEWLDAH